MPKKINTVKAKIGKCIYNIEMEEKESIHSIQLEIEVQMELKNQEFEILEISYDQNKTTIRNH